MHIKSIDLSAWTNEAPYATVFFYRGPKNKCRTYYTPTVSSLRRVVRAQAAIIVAAYKAKP